MIPRHRPSGGRDPPDTCRALRAGGRRRQRLPDRTGRSILPCPLPSRILPAIRRTPPRSLIRLADPVDDDAIVVKNFQQLLGFRLAIGSTYGFGSDRKSPKIKRFGDGGPDFHQLEPDWRLAQSNSRHPNQISTITRTRPRPRFVSVTASASMLPQIGVVASRSRLRILSPDAYCRLTLLAQRCRVPTSH